MQYVLVKENRKATGTEPLTYLRLVEAVKFAGSLLSFILSLPPSPPLERGQWN